MRIFLLGTAVAAMLFPSFVAAQPAIGKVGVAGVLLRSYTASKTDLTGEAEKMPRRQQSGQTLADLPDEQPGARQFRLSVEQRRPRCCLSLNLEPWAL
jgi:hypothetical protein